jgi:hypothetical protein
MDLPAPLHAFICVEVYIDGKKVGGNGKFMRVEVGITCKQVLESYVQSDAIDYSPLPGDTKVIMMCTVVNGTVESVKDCSVFLDFTVLMAMTEIPTKRFTFKCSRPVEEQRPRVDAIRVLMASQSVGNVHLPAVRARCKVPQGLPKTSSLIKRYLKLILQSLRSLSI